MIFKVGYALLTHPTLASLQYPLLGADKGAIAPLTPKKKQTD